MIEMYSSGPSKDKKLLAEAQQMFADAKRKIEYIRMQILRSEQRSVDNTLDNDSRWMCGCLEELVILRERLFIALECISLRWSLHSCRSLTHSDTELNWNALPQFPMVGKIISSHSAAVGINVNTN